MPKRIDQLHLLLQGMSVKHKTAFIKCVLSPPSLSDKPVDNVYIDVDGKVRKHPDAPSWVDMWNYTHRINEFRTLNPSTAQGCRKLYEDCIELFHTIIYKHNVPLDEWRNEILLQEVSNARNVWLESKLLRDRCIALEWCGMAIWHIGLRAQSFVMQLQEKEDKEEMARLARREMVVARCARTIATTACANVVTKIRAERKAAALTVISAALLPWMLTRVSKRREKAGVLKEVIAHNRRIANDKTRAKC